MSHIGGTHKGGGEMKTKERIFKIHNIPTTVSDISEITVNDHGLIFRDSNCDYTYTYRTKKPVILELPIKNRSQRQVNLELKNVTLRLNYHTDLLSYADFKLSETDDNIILKFDNAYDTFSSTKYIFNNIEIVGDDKK